MQPIRRLRAYARQIQKERPGRWMDRLARARAQCWRKLHDHMHARTLGEVELARFERHMRRLSALTFPGLRRDHRWVSLLFYTPITLFPDTSHFQRHLRDGRVAGGSWKVD